MQHCAPPFGSGAPPSNIESNNSAVAIASSTPNADHRTHTQHIYKQDQVKFERAAHHLAPPAASGLQRLPVGRFAIVPGRRRPDVRRCSGLGAGDAGVFAAARRWLAARHAQQRETQRRNLRSKRTAGDESMKRCSATAHNAEPIPCRTSPYRTVTDDHIRHRNLESSYFSQVSEVKARQRTLDARSGVCLAACAARASASTSAGLHSRIAMNWL